MKIFIFVFFFSISQVIAGRISLSFLPSLSDGQPSFVKDNELHFNHGFDINYSFLPKHKKSNFINFSLESIFFSISLLYDRVGTARRNYIQNVDEEGNILETRNFFKSIFTYDYFGFDFNLHLPIIKNDLFLIEIVTGLGGGIYLSQQTSYAPKDISDTKISHFYFLKEEEITPLKGPWWHIAISYSHFFLEKWSLNTEIKYSQDLLHLESFLPFYKINLKLGASFYFL